MLCRHISWHWHETSGTITVPTTDLSCLSSIIKYGFKHNTEISYPSSAEFSSKGSTQAGSFLVVLHWKTEERLLFQPLCCKVASPSELAWLQQDPLWYLQMYTWMDATIWLLI